MTKLEQLREAEENAQLQIEKAEKDAQGIRFAIPDLLEKKSREHDERLVEIEKTGTSEIDERISRLSEDLEKEAEKKMKMISKYGEELRNSAVEIIGELILKSGTE